MISLPPTKMDIVCRTAEPRTLVNFGKQTRTRARSDVLLGESRTVSLVILEVEPWVLHPEGLYQPNESMADHSWDHRWPDLDQ
jgi:hypothetical protein